MGLLLMLATILWTFGALAALGLAVAYRLVWLRNFIFGATVIWFAIYAVLLVSASALSREELLEMREPKAFCGFYLDCHLHAELIEAVETKREAGRERQVNVTVRFFSDAKAATLSLTNVKASVHLEDGTVIKQPEGVAPGVLLSTPIESGGSFEARFTFDLPQGTGKARLLVTEGSTPERVLEMFLVGDEDSLLHRRKYFDLSTTAAEKNPA